jgi:hypothetical protein
MNPASTIHSIREIIAHINQPAASADPRFHRPIKSSIRVNMRWIITPISPPMPEVSADHFVDPL